LGIFPASPTLWDTSAILSDRGTVGGFLAGLVGYRARPSLLELLAYATYLVVVATLFFSRPASPTSAPRGTREPAEVA